MTDRPIPLSANLRSRMLLERLSEGPASTLQLQRELPLVHVARQVWELRTWYHYRIKTGRLPNRVALYTLLPSPDATPAGPPNVEKRGEALAVRGLFDGAAA